jgi:Cu/Zn superoxide dismutase
MNSKICGAHIYEICSDTTTKVNTNSCFLVADGFHNPTRENSSHSVLEKKTSLVLVILNGCEIWSLVFILKNI